MPTGGESSLTPDSHPVYVCREGLPRDFLARENKLTGLGEMWIPGMHHGALEEMLAQESLC